MGVVLLMMRLENLYFSATMSIVGIPPTNLRNSHEDAERFE
jgi:hypothetical protein